MIDIGLNALKEVIMGLLFTVTLLFVCIPMKLAHNAQRSGIDIFHSERYSKIVSLLNCFAAGIFLGTCLLHLFPDVRENVTAAVALIDPTQNFPFAEFTIVMGFMLLLTIEQVMADIRVRRIRKQFPSLPNSTIVAIQSQQLPSIQETEENDSIDNRSIDNNFDNSVLIDTVPSNSLAHHRHESRNQEPLHHHHDRETEQTDDQHSVRLVAMIFAISVHSLFEGIAIGVQPTEEEVLQIVSALVIHKLVISFSIGLSLTQSSLKILKSAILGFIFAISTPTGTAIGLGVSIIEKDLNNSILIGTLQGLAAGTFLYVTFMDLLPAEFKNGEFQLPKLLSFIIGFSVICASLFLFPDS